MKVDSAGENCNRQAGIAKYFLINSGLIACSSIFSLTQKNPKNKLVFFVRISQSFTSLTVQKSLRVVQLLKDAFLLRYSKEFETFIFKDPTTKFREVSGDFHQAFVIACVKSSSFPLPS